MTGSGREIGGYGEALARLPLADLELEWELEAPLPLPFPGAFLRGVLGNRLRRRCPTGGRGAPCPPGSGCPWCDLFSPLPGRGTGDHWSGGLRTIPVPYALRSTGEEWSRGLVRVLLLGRAVGHAGAVVEAFREAGEAGLGRQRVRALVVEARSRLADAGGEVERVLASCGGEAVVFRALSPLRLKERGRWCHRPTPRLLAVAAARRVSALCFHHGAGENLPAPSREWLQELEGLRPAGEEWTWQDGSRWSARQRRRYPVGGVVGEVVLADPDPALRFLLAAGAVLGLGKGIAYGLGRCSLEPA